MNPTTLPPPWSELAERLGGVEALAAALGTTTMTLWRWSRGRTLPHPIVQGHVNAFFRRRGFAPPFAEAA